MDLFANLFGGGLPQIDPKAAHSRLQADPQLLLLDVRTPEEYAQGHAPGATLIPLDELPARLAEVPTDREILCICHSGSRSSAATRLLRSSGRQVTNVTGGMDLWERQRLPVQR